MHHGPWHELLLTAAAGVLVGGGALFVALSLVARRGDRLAPVHRRAAKPDPAAATARFLSIVAISLALGAALIHLAAAPSHVEELGPMGWGFVGAALFQGAWALSWAVSPTRGVALTGMAGSLAIVAAWAWSRTVGLPVGPMAGTAEAVGLPDAFATTFELGLAGLLAGWRSGGSAGVAAALRRTPSLPVIAVVPAVGLVVVATTLAATLALSHEHGPGTEHAAPLATSGESGH